jgi:hypothetical protein
LYCPPPQSYFPSQFSGPSSSSRAPPLHQFQPFMSPAHHPPHNVEGRFPQPHSGYPPQESQARYLQSQHYYPQFGAPYPGGMWTLKVCTEFVADQGVANLSVRDFYLQAHKDPQTIQVRCLAVVPSS